MLKKFNLQELIEHNDLNNSCCGKCSKCGE